jgi:protein-S-isoprenylcysteine O-methyltransferase Ste14
MSLDVFFLKIQVPFRELIPFYFQVLISIPFFIVSGYLARSGLKKVFGEKRDSLQVVRSGVFSLVRHPVYLGSILLFFSFLLLSMSAIALIIWIIIVIFYVFLSRYEEKILIEKLRKDYEQYMKEVPMFIPKIFRKNI